MKSALLILFFASLAVKIALAGWVPLTADEAYYWVWSHHLQLSYFDHPPFVSWLFWLGHPLENVGSLVRVPGILMGHGTFVIWYFLIRRHLSSIDLSSSLLLALASPLLGVGSSVITPDIPLVFFWSLSILLLLETLKNPKAITYALLGASLGLGFCSKYNIVLFVPTALIALGVTHQFSFVKWKYLVLTVVLGLIFSAPVIIWNAQNHFESFLFQTNHGLGAKSWNPEWTGEYILGQVALITPFLLPLLWRLPAAPNLKILWVFLLLPFSFFLFSSFKGHVEMNWPLASFPALMVLASQETFNPKLRWAYYGLWIPLLIFTTVHLVKPVFSWMPGKINEPYRYQNLISEVGGSEPIYFGTYQMAAYIWFETKKPFYKLKGASRIDFFDTFEESTPKTKEFLLFLHKDQGLPDWINSQIQSKTKVKEIEPEFEIWRILTK